MLSLQAKKTKLNLFSVVFFLFILTATSYARSDVVAIDTVEEEEEEEDSVDPFEGFNRKTYGFNESVDDYLLEPVSDAYLWVTPEFFQQGISNFFNNLKDINVVVNDLLQGKVVQSGEDTGRFLVNSTLGIGGLFDVATGMGLERHEEDFAQTLAVWGVPQGPYLIIPFLGPMTTRGVPGSLFDTAANPATYVGYPIQLLQMLNARANADGALSFIDEAALDPYIFTRESFLQYRKNLIADGNIEFEDDFLDLEDDFYDDDESEVSLEAKLDESDQSHRFMLDLKSPTSVEVDIDEKIKQARLKLESRSSYTQ
jgi:phospholipid-binding lipoprotein MlaA